MQGRASRRWCVAALVFLAATIGQLAVAASCRWIGSPAVLWEFGEWYAFIRHGTELATAYPDTLGDEALGTLGAAVAAALLTLWPGSTAGTRDSA